MGSTVALATQLDGQRLETARAVSSSGCAFVISGRRTATAFRC